MEIREQKVKLWLLVTSHREMRGLTCLSVFLSTYFNVERGAHVHTVRLWT